MYDNPQTFVDTVDGPTEIFSNATDILQKEHFSSILVRNRRRLHPSSIS